MEIIAVFRIETINDAKVTTYTKSQKLKKSRLNAIDSLPLFALEVVKIGRGKYCDVRIDNPVISSIMLRYGQYNSIVIPHPWST